MSTELAKRDQDQELEAVSEQPIIRPNVDIYENRDEYLVLADLPAVDRDNLNIRLEDSQLTIEGRVHDGHKQTPLEREFYLHNYQRSFALPEHVDQAKVTAELSHGVLTLHLPKTDAVKPRRIEVRAG